MSRLWIFLIPAVLLQFLLLVGATFVFMGLDADEPLIVMAQVLTLPEEKKAVEVKNAEPQRVEEEAPERAALVSLAPGSPPGRRAPLRAGEPKAQRAALPEPPPLPPPPPAEKTPSPAPQTPSPAPPEPVKPEPVKPEPQKPEPQKPEPVKPEPVALPHAPADVPSPLTVAIPTAKAAAPAAVTSEKGPATALSAPLPSSRVSRELSSRPGASSSSGSRSGMGRPGGIAFGQGNGRAGGGGTGGGEPATLRTPRAEETKTSPAPPQEHPAKVVESVTPRPVAAPAEAPAAETKPPEKPAEKAVETPKPEPSPAVAFREPPPVEKKKEVPPTRPVLLSLPSPAYPREMREEGVSGSVRVCITVSRSGGAQSVSVARSSGHSSMDRAALDAARCARFTPATRNGEPVESRITVTIRFALH